jgi:protein-serine/threonine kinase|tara:strand:+ start:3234 stop:3605 length:372 start_codon:yes stop_codon:yes gene_type:complete
MTSRPPEALPTFTFPPRPQTATEPDRRDSQVTTASTIASTPAVDGRPKPPKRPALVSRASDSSSTIRPRHLSTKSSSAIPTLSNLSVRNSGLPTYWQSPKMTTSNGGTSSGAADLLRQAMMQR